MRELIALRAKIDLLSDDTVNTLGYSEYIDGYMDAMKQVKSMIDDMVGTLLEDMYAEHIQEEASQTN